MRGVVASREGPVSMVPFLSGRENEILPLVAEGLSTRAIAGKLFVSEQAVTYHVSNLLSKFNRENRAGLVSLAYHLGFLDPQVWPPRLAQGTLSNKEPK
jgi:DNA-binding NarL/FixJ family response regulator